VRTGRRRGICALALGLALGLGCAGSAPPPAPPAPDALPGLAELLVPTQDMGDGFVLRQRLQFHATGPDRDARSGGFEAIVQLDCGELVVVGLSPFGTRAFSIRQRGSDARFEWAYGEPLPFSLERVLLDVHRSFLYPLADPPPDDGWHVRHYGPHGAVEARESWSGGRLRERHIEERSGSRTGPWVATYDGGFGADAWPEATRISSEVFGYTLEITTVERKPLSCPP